MFGAGAAQMLGVPLLSIIPQEGRAQAETMLWNALTSGAVGGFEFPYRDAQGGRRQLAASVAPVANELGVIVGTSAVVRDITNRLVLQDQLAQSRKMASLGQMAGTMAHYFNNILGGIVTSVDFALASDNPAMQKRVLEKTAKALSRASHLLDSLLTFAEGDYKTADLADLTESFLEVVEQVTPELEEANITAQVDVEPIPVTAVPSVQMRTVLSNLIHNAIEAMPDGGKLTLSLGPAKAPEEGLAIRITDTGCGVPDEQLDRLFEPFYSTKSAMEEGESVGRPGLGLAVAHGIVQVLGGRISVKSSVGVGSTFEVVLPVRPRFPSR
jgi:PAS domain S-box-containing protein